ncbi:hypothetical protein QR680_005446 [Steinernema hermaphroditum]|uniref:Globin domain-containing protein n=1 Tax=Steinernema hermaphroditum TaxID=289476 RepID=A0AA39HS30_9BILA|nr:hypothetical protein QR680_005446 [Steinernema hermaphroditum]
MLTEKSGDTVTIRRFFSQKLRGTSAKENSSSAYIRKPSKLFEGAPPIDLPQIRVTSERRTSICSNLRFSRTFSSDSIDSLEKLCRKDLRRRRIMMEPEERPQNIPMEMLLLSPTSSTYPSLRCVGRSRTDPENDTDTLSRSPGASGESPKLKAQLDVRLKRSSPDLSVDASGAKPRTLSEVIGLSAYQQKLLLQCWPNIYSTGLNANFASNIYQNLCNRNAKAKQLMQKADGVAVFCQSDIDCTTLHAKLTLELVDTVIRSLDKSPQNLLNYLQEIGLCHKALKREGMTLSIWDDLGDAILDGVRRHDAVRKHKELRRAWLGVIAFLTDNLKQGQSSFRASPSMSMDIPDSSTSSTTSQQP